MNIVSVSEDKNLEKRIAVTPEIAQKYLKLGFELFFTVSPDNSIILVANVIFFSASTLPVLVKYVLHTFLTSNAIELFIN